MAQLSGGVDGSQGLRDIAQHSPHTKCQSMTSFSAETKCLDALEPITKKILQCNRGAREDFVVGVEVLVRTSRVV